MGRDFDDVLIEQGQEAVAAAVHGAQAPPAEDHPPAPVTGTAADAAEIIEAAIAATLAGDAGALFEDPVLAALRELSPPAWARTRARIKRECKEVRITDLDRQLRAEADTEADDGPATVAVRLAREQGEYFRDAERIAYASVRGAQARETWRIDGQGFRDWLAALYYRETGSGLSEQAMATAINTLRAVALHDGEEHPVGLRAAACAEGVVIDLGDATWHAVLVTASGWRLIEPEALPVRLYRAQGMQALPTPVVGGDVAWLWQHINVPKAERPLLLAWLLDALRPGTPYPVLELCGPQGAAKSSTQRRLRALIDPHVVPLRGRPKCAEDAFIAAGAGYLVSYENVSGLHPDTQDAFCVLATGGGFATRRLYTNAEESVIHAHRPVVMNGISANATRPDLIDRLVHIALPEITERKTEAEIDAAFVRDAGAIMGGLLDLYAAALARLPAVEIAPRDLPRLADYTLLGEAMTQAQGDEAGTFLKLFVAHRAENMTRALDASPLAQAVISLIEGGGEVLDDTAKHAFERLQQFRPAHADSPFPASPKSMMDHLRRYATALRLLNIVVTEHGRGKHGYTLSIRRHTPPADHHPVSKSRSPRSPHSPAADSDEHGERGEPKNAPACSPENARYAPAGRSCADLVDDVEVFE